VLDIHRHREGFNDVSDARGTGQAIARARDDACEA
jgi:hypothetical protein